MIKGIDCKEDEGSTPLILAAKAGHLNVVKFLLKLGASYEAKTDTNQSALHKAAARGHVGIMKFLIASGANIECQDSESAFPNI